MTLSPSRQEIYMLMDKYAGILQLKDKRILDVGIAGDPQLDGATSPSEKYRWFGEGNTFETLDNDPATRPDTVGDICEAPYLQDTFDLVIVSETLEHVYDYQRALRECNRILKDRGYLIVDTPWLVDWHPTETTPDYWRFSEDAYRTILAANGFKIMDFYSSPNIKGALAIKL